MEEEEEETRRERENPNPFVKSILGASVPPPPPAESNVWPTLPSESRGFIKNLNLVGTIIMLVAWSDTSFAT